MSTVIRSCTGCKSLILSDTDQCPECGHVLHERKNTAPSTTFEGSSLRSATLLDPCPHCGEMVRTGLVRCWSCNGFMREDIAERYRKMTSNPQQIIYSTIPQNLRTDYLPPRVGDDKNAVPKAYDSEGFVLTGSAGFTKNQPAKDEFALGVGTSKSTAAQPAAQASPPTTPVSKADATKPAVPVDGPDKPTERTRGGAAPAPETASDTGQAKGTDSAGTDAPSKATRGSKAGDDDLLAIAMQDEREVKKRRSDKLADRKQKQMLVPCSCGAWIRVHESQAGKVVRCRKCKQPINVPKIRRKVDKKKEQKAAGIASMDVSWIEDVRFFRLAPTSIVMKPGSVADKFIEADLAITDSQIVVIAFSGGDKKKRGLLSKAPKVDRAEQRKQVREQVSKAGNFNDLADVEVHTIAADHVSEIRLVQPILKAHESMFAGVPVFGDGRLAVFLPITFETGEQAYCSQALSAFRTLCNLLKTKFNLELPAADNGVPMGEKVDNLNCFINQSRVEALRDVKYYEQDPAFELELSGFRCKACTAVVSEEGRLKNKLGGANGKAIAKAKCPKCSGKMGEERLYLIKKAGSLDAPAQ